jgi:SAM-dependent methyltransferase
MRLLDAGCGPGSITLGLADAIGPDGQAVGIDASGKSIAAARALAADRDIPNVRFSVADIHALPFADGTFDAAFIHAVLQHLPDPLAALREVRRVMKPGAVIGIGDADLDGSLIWPATPALDRSIRLMAELSRAEGGSPHVGRRLRTALHDAGFSPTAASVIADADGASEATMRTGAFWAALHESPPFLAHITALGLATEPELHAMAAAWRKWGADSGAFWARFWCHAVGWAPLAVP